MIRVYIDGSARPNRGGIGIVIRGETYDYSISEHIPEKVSNNEVEYKALNRALRELMANKLTDGEIVIYSSSRMLVEQTSGERDANQGKYYKDYLLAIKTIENFSNLGFKRIPREMNSEANRLASRAIGG